MFLGQSWLAGIIFLSLNFIAILLIYWIGFVNSQLTLQYNVMQNAQAIALNVQIIRDNITNTININTNLSNDNLSMMTLDDFNKDHRDLSEKYKAGQIQPEIYWNEVLGFYNVEIIKLGKSQRDAAVSAERLSKTSDLLATWSLIYALLFFPLNAFLTILLSRRIEPLV